MIELVRFGFGLLLVPITLVFFRYGDPVLVAIITSLFFTHQPHNVVWFAFCAGLLLDLFTPFFGSHLLSFAVLSVGSAMLIRNYLTARSFVSVTFVVVVATIANFVFLMFIAFAYSLISSSNDFAIDWYSALREIVFGVLINCLLALGAYLVMRREA